MANKNIVPGFTKPYFWLFGVLAGLVFWVIESAIHSYLFSQTAFIDNLVTPETHELWMRLVVIFLFSALGVYSHIFYTHRQRTTQALYEAHEQLERRVKERTAELSVVNKQLEQEITERKKTEEEKGKIQTQLFRAQKMEALGTLAGGVAHDFNNLLTVIKVNIDMAMMKSDSKSPLIAYLKRILDASMRAANLTRQLLLLGRKQPMESTAFNINSTVTDLLKMLKPIIGEDIIIKTDLGPDILTVRADKGNFEQVLMNLAVNARDAMPQGGKLNIKTEIVTVDKAYCKINSGARPGKFVCLSIEDSGTGMDKETLQHIFEPFFSTKEQGKGTGLGLATVYGIVKQHNGWINVYSEPGHGSMFKIYLPSFSAKPEKETKATTPLQKFQGKNERILMVEDDEGIRESTAGALMENGYVIYKAAGVKEALEIFKREKGDFHLVFSDMIMPDGTGFDLVNQLLSLKPELRVLLSSGYSDEKSQWQIIRDKGLRFISKPYALADLFRVIREIIEKAK